MTLSSPFSVCTRVCNNIRRSFFGPLHLLFLAESSAHHFVHCRLHKSRRDWLAVAIPFPVIRDQVPIIYNVCAQFRQGFDQLSKLGIALSEGLHRGLQVVDLAKGFVNLTMHNTATSLGWAQAWEHERCDQDEHGKVLPPTQVSSQR